MKTDKEILDQAIKLELESGNFRWKEISLLAIELAQKDLFDYLQKVADDNENDTITREFLEEMELKLF